MISIQSSNPEVSVVFPVFNELENLEELIARTSRVCASCGRSYEMLFVDDGSSDGSAERLAAEASKDPHVKVVLFSRNFNQHAAIAACFKFAKGDIVVQLDADLQDQPEDLPKLLSKIYEGYDIVYGIREARSDTRFRRLGARLYFRLFESLSGYSLPEDVATYRALRRRAVDAFNSMSEHSRFTAGMMAWLGFSVGMVPINHAPRMRGKSKYNVAKLIGLAIDGILSSSEQPLRMASFVGIFLAGFSLLIGIYMLYRALFYGFVITGYASLIVSLFFLSGVHLFFLGIIGEYLARVFKNVQGRPIYVVKETLNLD